MYVTEEMVADMAARFGTPKRARYSFPLNDREQGLIRASLAKGRAHDFTLYVHHKGQLLVIAKHSYPHGLYRAPSGGLNPGEPFLDGIAREALEETGCEIAIQRFALRTEVNFWAGTESLNWQSFVFEAAYVRGELLFTDKQEIREVRWANPSEFETFSAMMRQTDVGGFHYRAALHDTVSALLNIGAA
ncbi:MAG: NUDIX hydrolase [Candidatus Zixiibacteriota bacterium]